MNFARPCARAGFIGGVQKPSHLRQFGGKRDPMDNFHESLHPPGRSVIFRAWLALPNSL